MKLFPPKETTNVKMYASLVKPGRGRRKTVYTFKGLRGRKIGKGVYRFRASGELPHGSRLCIQVSISEPWCRQKSWTASATCTEHGPSCPCDEEDCVVKLAPVEVCRWQAIMTPNDGFFDVGIYRLRSSKTRSPLLKLADGAGFAVCAVVPLPRKEPCTS